MNSLAQTLLKLAAPACRIFIRGSNCGTSAWWNPDNRRPVDFALRRQLLDRAADALGRRGLAGMEFGIAQTVADPPRAEFARRRPVCWTYPPLRGAGGQGPRRRPCRDLPARENLIAIAPRLVIGLHNDWRDTTLDLPEGLWRNELADGPVAGKTALLSDLLGQFPVALLVREEKP